MPELPEVETVCRALQGAISGSTIDRVTVSTKPLRNQIPAEALNGQLAGRHIQDIRRRGKFIIVDLGVEVGLLLHLGMTGSCRVAAAAARPVKHDHVVWHLRDGRDWIFNDPRRFGQVRLCRLAGADRRPDELSHLGPEPLGPAFTPAYLLAQTARRHQPIKNLIMDQRVVVGVGNIYASEALFAARILPRRQAWRISVSRLAALVEAIREVLRDAISCGGTTIRNFQSLDGSEGRFRACLQVYDRAGKPCPHCAAPVRRTVLAGRATYDCPRCQH